MTTPQTFAKTDSDHLYCLAVDFVKNKVRASRTMIPWPDADGKPRRASINSFGYGGANAHAIIEEATSKDRSYHISSFVASDDVLSLEDEDDEETTRPHVLVLSANDAKSLKANIQALCDHLINPRVKVNLSDLAYTLSERRSKLWHLAYVTTRNTELEPKDFTVAKKNTNEPKIGFVFTGQGAQWPQMGKELLQFFPWTRDILQELDQVLQTVPEPPNWSLLRELTEHRSADHIRQPEFSQPLVTAIQLCILDVLEKWGVKPSSVVGHSSGEIAAAYAAGFIDRASAIKAAFYRGRAAVNRKNESDPNVGMLAVGLGTEAVVPFLEKYKGRVWIACYNSPSSLTISGKKTELELLAEDIKSAGHFARLLQVDLAYHSELMNSIGEEYEALLTADSGFSVLDDAPSSGVTMLSSAIAEELTAATRTDAAYWKKNMVSPVRFQDAVKQMLYQPEDKSPDFLIEIGPSGALAGPVSQILKSLPSGSEISYCASWARGANAVKALFDVAGRLTATGAPIDMSLVNGYHDQEVRTIIDLPNYNWNHSIKYWHENAASKDWRFRKFIHHDLIGSKIFGTSWHNPTWRKHLMLDDVPWLRDHMMGPDVLIPGAGLATMAVEAMYQKHCALNPDLEISSSNELAYKLRNVRFDRALVVEENKECTILLTLTRVPGGKDWHEFRISTSKDDVVIDHCFGLIRVEDSVEEKLSPADLAPLRNPQPFTLWYKAQREAGMGFGPSFKKVTSLEAVSGQRTCRAMVDLTAPSSKWDPQSYYPFHPAVLDACLQVAMPANASNERSLVKDIIVPGIVNEAIINKVPRHMREGLAIAKSGYTGRGRPDQAKSIISDISVYDPETGAMFMQVKGLNYVKIDVPPKPDPHTFDRISWQPDVSILTQDQLSYLTPNETSNSKLHTVIDLIAHKTPMLKVLEINLEETDTSSTWFETNDMSARLAYVQYDFASSNAEALVAAQSKNESNRHSAFHLIAPEKPSFGLSGEAIYDLAIIKASKKSISDLDSLISNLKPLLADNAYTLLVQIPVDISGSESILRTPEDTGDSIEDDFQDLQTDSPGSGSIRSESSSEVGGMSSSISSESIDSLRINEALSKVRSGPFGSRWKLNKVQESLDSLTVLELSDNGPRGRTLTHYLLHNGPKQQQQHVSAPLPKNLVVWRLSENTPPAARGLLLTLQAAGWNVTQRHSSATIENLRYPEGTVVLVLDELSGPLLVDASSHQWDALKQLLSAGSPVLWVTKGSQHLVTNPDNALIHGLFRVVRHEDTAAQLTTIDVQSSTSAATLWAINQVLDLVHSGHAEDEYVERDGLLHVQRIMPDAKVNAFKRNEAEGAETIVKGLHETEAMVQIRAERVGSLELTWCENHIGQIPVEPGFVEVEVMTVGVNFKVCANSTSNQFHTVFVTTVLTYHA
jgi:acyl transferase domain-containing protein